MGEFSIGWVGGENVKGEFFTAQIIDENEISDLPLTYLFPVSK